MTEPVEPRPSGLGHQPALDGLRAVAVVAVLLFHGGFGWASGGYLGVSLFFTLSGFLITRLLLDERARTGRIDLGRFYARRIRRLLPASCLTLLGIIVLTKLGAFDGVTDPRRDLVGAAAQLGNWAQLTSGRSYADLFNTGASPVEHYWSLAVEEQFYLVWPLLFLALIGGRSVRWAQRSALGLFVVAAALAPVIAHVWGSDAAYLSTPARLAELFAGVALAVVLRHRSVPAWFGWVAVAALAAFVLLVGVTPSGSGWAYAGGLPLFALLSVALIAGLQVDGPVRRLLALRPFAALGAISYGVYLVHWPIFLLADAHPGGLGAVPLFAAKCAATLAVATASYWVVERPVRRSHPPLRVNLGAALAATLLVAGVAAVVVPGPAPGFGQVGGDKVAAVRIPPAGSGLVPLVNGRGGQQRPLRILVVGDSTGDVMGGGLVEWAAAHPALAQVDVESLGGCGFVTGGRFDGVLDSIRAQCDQRMHHDLPASYPTLRPDVVLISIAAADSWNRSWVDGGPLLRPTDPTYAARIRTGYRDFFADAVRAGVPHVVWLRPAQIGTERKYADPSYLDGSQELIQRVVEAQVAAHPKQVQVLDFRAWFETTAYPHDLKVRPDGVHLIPAVAAAVATDWLGPQLLALAGAAR